MKLRAHRDTGDSGAHPVLQCGVDYRIPNMPGIDGIPIRPPWDIFFIIFCISRNCSSRRLTSLIVRPEPRATRARRDPLSNDGS